MPGRWVLLFRLLLGRPSGSRFGLLFRRRGEGARADVRGVRGPVGIGSYGVERREFAAEPFGPHGGRTGRLDPLHHDDVVVRRRAPPVRRPYRWRAVWRARPPRRRRTPRGRRVECLGQNSAAAGEPQARRGRSNRRSPGRAARRTCRAGGRPCRRRRRSRGFRLLGEEGVAFAQRVTYGVQEAVGGGLAPARTELEAVHTRPGRGRGTERSCGPW